MRIVNLFISCFFFLCHSSDAQQLIISNTEFIGGNLGYTYIRDAISTSDGGVFFCGQTTDPGSGNIPANTSSVTNSNILIGKLDSNGQREWLKIFGSDVPEWGTAACEAADGGFIVVDGSDIDSTSGQFVIHKLNSAGDSVWTRHYGSSLQEGPISVTATQDGGFLIFGFSSGFDGDIPFNYTPQAVFKLWDWVLIKVDSLGNKQWVKVLGTTGDEWANGKILTDGQYYYMISSTQSKDYDCIDTLWHPGLTKGYNIYVFKLDTTGDVLWSKSYGFGFASTAMLDVRDSTIAIAGIGPDNSQLLPGNHGDNDMFLLKIDRNGNFIWGRQFGDSNQEWGQTIAAGPGNTYLLGGYSYMNDQTPYNHIGRYDAWVFWIDSAGIELGSKIFGNTNYDQLERIQPLGRSFLAFGRSSASSFTEGTGINPHAPRSTPFISTMHFWGLSAPEIGTTEGDGIIIYPNPAQRMAVVEFRESHSDGLLQLLSGSGVVLWSHQIPTSLTRLEIALDQYAKGTYYLEWKPSKGPQKHLKVFLR